MNYGGYFIYYNVFGKSKFTEVIIADGSLTFRNAERKDAALILQFIKDLADCEKMSDEVVADEALLKAWIFDKQKAEVIFAVEDGKEIGFALFFHNFSTRLNAAAVAWNGGVWTGTNPALISTFHLGRSLCRTGRFTVLRVIH